MNLKEMTVMIPANTELTCPVCEDEITITKDMYDGDTIVCEGCDATLVLEDGVLEEEEEDIFEDEDEVEEEDLYDDRKGDKNIKFRT